RGVDIARTAAARGAVREQALALLTEARQWLGRAEKNRVLLDALLEVSAPQETRQGRSDRPGLMLPLTQKSADEQYVDAFRRWGLDVDGTPEEDVVARLRQEPDAVVEEVIAALDTWMLERQHSEARWRRLFRVADRLDKSARRRQLRGIVVERMSPRVE